MKINAHFVSLPPHLSFAWEEVSCLSYDGEAICFALVSGGKVYVKELPRQLIEMIFTAHAAHLELRLQESTHETREPGEIAASAAFFGEPGLHFGINLPPIGMPQGNIGMLHHMSEHSRTPDLPKEILAKIASVVRALGPLNEEVNPKAEPHCNCMYCQVMREVQGGNRSKELSGAVTAEEVVEEKDLHFEQWTIQEMGTHLYTVTNKLNHQESYSVSLDSATCSCGERHCEHLKAALRS